MFVIRRAAKQDLFQMRRLLNEAGLNDHGIEDHLRHFFVVESPGEKENPPQIVGAIGMEVYRPYGLLRSFVLKRASWNPGIGVKLIHILLSYAGHLKLSHVYLLAGASASFFEEMGFSVIPFEEIPEDIQESEHMERTASKGTPMVYSCFPTDSH
jgi:N-acetylglutamate synthase-like GNAT family acetyltransferase